MAIATFLISRRAGMPALHPMNQTPPKKTVLRCLAVARAIGWFWMIPLALGLILTLLLLAAHQTEREHEYLILAAMDAPQPLQLPSCLHPLTIRDQQSVVFARWKSKSLDYEGAAVVLELPEGAAVDFMFEQELVFDKPQSRGLALTLAHHGRALSLSVTAIEAHQRDSQLTLPDMMLPSESATVSVRAQCRDNQWHFYINEAEAGVMPSRYPQTTFSIASRGSPVQLHRILLYHSDNRSFQAFSFGLYFLAVIAGNGSLLFGVFSFGCLQAAFTWLIIRYSRTAYRKALLADACSYSPILVYLAIAFQRAALSKAYLIAMLFLTVILKLWFGYLIGAAYPSPRRWGSARALRSGVSCCLLAVVLSIFSFPSLRTISQTRLGPLQLDQEFNYGHSSYFKYLVAEGDYEITLKLDADSVMECSLRGIEGTDRFGFLISSDPKLPSRFFRSRYDQIEHWTGGRGVVFPSGEWFTLRFELARDSVSVWRHDVKIARSCDPSDRINRTDRTGFFAVKGQASVKTIDAVQRQTARSRIPELRAVTRALIPLLIPLLAATMLALLLETSWRSELTFSLWSSIPWLATLALAEMSNHAGAAATGRLGTAQAAGLGLLAAFLTLRLALEAPARSWRVFAALLLVSLSGFGLLEDFLESWSPDGFLYFKFSFDMNTQTPVPPGYEWYFVPRMRYCNDFLYLNNYFYQRQIPLEKAPGTTRVICLGGSTTAGDANQRRRRTDYVSALELQLNERSSQTHEVINGGIYGYTTAQCRLWFDEVLQSFKPDWVVLNSMVNNSILYSTHDQAYHFEQITHDPGGLWSGLRYRLNNTRLSMLLWDYYKERLRTDKRRYSVSPFQFYRFLMRFIAAQGRGFKLVLVEEPSTLLVYQTTDGIVTRYEEYYQALDLFCSKYGVPCVKVADKMRRYPRERVFVDLVHLTEFGNRILAEGIRDAILAREQQSGE